VDRLRNAIESTVLAPGAGPGDVHRLVTEAVQLGVVGACVPPRYVGLARELAGERPLRIVTVANFPFGYSAPGAVVREIELVAAAGADEVDVVAPLGLALAGEWDTYEAELRTQAEAAAAAGVQLKCILETAALDAAQIRWAAERACAAGVHWLKTSTGFHPAGGATVDAVAILRSVAPTGVGVKASGGIRDRQIAEAMLAAGADRIGTSSAARILAGG